jgi:hypothetical protein
VINPYDPYDPCDPWPPLGATVVVTAEDLTMIRSLTNDAPGWSDTQLTIEAQNWPLSLDVAISTNPLNLPVDRFAVAAMILELRLLDMVIDPQQGSTAIRTGDAQIEYERSTSKTLLLRSFIQRYWNNAYWRNRKRGQVIGWRSVHVTLAHERRRVPGLCPPQVVNGPLDDEQF